MNDARRIWVNGRETPFLQATDRGVLYGDGLFETILVRNGKAPLLDRHLTRILNDGGKLGLPIPSRNMLKQELESFLQSGERDAAIKCVITRGSSGRGYAPSGDTTASVLMFEYPMMELTEQQHSNGFITGVCTTRLGINPALAGIKHLNRLEQVLAAEETRTAGLDEGIMLDINNMVIEGTRTNLFAVDNGKLITPTLDGSGVAGIMREMVIEFSNKKGKLVTICDITLDHLERCEEVFVSNSIHGVIPVRKIDDRDYSLGPVTHELQLEAAKWLGMVK